MSLKSSIAAVLIWAGLSRPAPVSVEPSVGSTWLDPKQTLERVTSLYEEAVSQANTALGVLAKQRQSHLTSVQHLMEQVAEHDSHIDQLQSVKNQVASALSPAKPDEASVSGQPVEPPAYLG
uniref:Uncharacterized protein n=1 Tax=Pseudomonas phage Cygsa01 TaxID=3138529 RepID=A0AAU6W3Y6_9VIRU